MVLPFCFPAKFDSPNAGLEEAKKREKSPPIDSDLSCRFLPKIPPTRQANSPQPRIAESSSIKADSFSSVRTTKR